MKARLLLIVAMAFLVFFSGTCWAINNPAGVPLRLTTQVVAAGSGTALRGSRRSGLVRSPNPIDTSSNLLITGNVGGGRHFRGVVPYRSASDFGAALGSSSLDSFLRRSAGSEDFGRYTTRYKPYYSATGTVTTTRPGGSGVIRPPTTKIDGRAADGFAFPPLHSEKTLSGLDVAAGTPKATRDVWEAVSNIRFRVPATQNIAFGLTRPMSMSPQELEKALWRQMGESLQDGVPAAEQRQEQTEQFRHDLKQLSDKAAVREDSRGELKQGLIIQDGSLQMEQQVEGFEKSLEQPVAARGTKEAVVREDSRGEAEGKPGEQDSHFVSSQSAEKALEVSEKSRRRASREGSQKAGSPGEDLRTLLREFSEVELAVRAKSILGEHETFASFSKDKFNQHIRAGENYLKEGKYYRAADVYTLALIYKPSDPLAYAGKSHALFAAGEYMSSALFLSRALEIFPEYLPLRLPSPAPASPDASRGGGQDGAAGQKKLLAAGEAYGEAGKAKNEKLKTPAPAPPVAYPRVSRRKSGRRARRGGGVEFNSFALCALSFTLIDRDRLESRTVDVEQWLEKNDAGELQFLLAYVYYQMGRLQRAKEAIDAAYEKMPESPAVIALKKAIDPLPRLAPRDAEVNDAIKSYQPVRE